MQSKAGIVIGAVAALALAGSTGAAAWGYLTDEGRPVGSWHDAPGAPQTPPTQERAAAAARAAVPSSAASPDSTPVPDETKATPAEKASPEDSHRSVLPESAQIAADHGRQKVG